MLDSRLRQTLLADLLKFKQVNQQADGLFGISADPFKPYNDAILLINKSLGLPNSRSARSMVPGYPSMKTVFAGNGFLQSRFDFSCSAGFRARIVRCRLCNLSRGRMFINKRPGKP
jgi:hypothetical protein